MTFSKKAKDFSSSKPKCLFFMPAFVRAFLFKSSPDGELSYKAIKKRGSTRHPANPIQLLFRSQPFHQSIFLNGSANPIANANLQSNKQNGE